MVTRSKLVPSLIRSIKSCYIGSYKPSGTSNISLQSMEMKWIILKGRFLKLRNQIWFGRLHGRHKQIWSAAFISYRHLKVYEAVEEVLFRLFGLADVTEWCHILKGILIILIWYSKRFIKKEQKKHSATFWFSFS